MGQVLHGSATTTEAVRRAIQHCQESLSALAKRRPPGAGDCRSRRRDHRPDGRRIEPLALRPRGQAVGCASAGRRPSVRDDDLPGLRGLVGGGAHDKGKPICFRPGGRAAGRRAVRSLASIPCGRRQGDRTRTADLPRLRRARHPRPGAREQREQAETLREFFRRLAYRSDGGKSDFRRGYWRIAPDSSRTSSSESSPSALSSNMPSASPRERPVEAADSL